MKKLIYLDNAATSHYKPRSVKKAIIKSLKTSANPGRSGHKLSLQNAINVYKTREIISQHFNLSNPNLVIFTKNCTEALNLAILGLVKNKNIYNNSYKNFNTKTNIENQNKESKKECITKNSKNSNQNFQPEITDKKHIICSCFEHNSVLRPLTYLKEQNMIELSIISPLSQPKIMLSDIKKAIKNNTFLVCLTQISNVTGAENDIEEIGKYCKNNNILFLLDCAQSAGHKKIDMQKLNINFLTFAGHKGFLAPQGIGALCINSNILPIPINFGGTGTDSINLNQPSSPPECFESGTLMTPSIIALSKGIKYVEKRFDKHNKKVENLTKYLIQKLLLLEKENILKLYSPKDVKHGVISFNITNCDSVEVSTILDQEYNIAVRGGLHCAPLTHKYFNTEKTGMVRVSLSFKNNKKDIKKLIKAIKYIYNLK